MSSKEERVNENENPVTEEESLNEAIERELQESGGEKNNDDIIIEQQSKRIEELENEIEKLRDNQLRRTAEMENMKRRMHKERLTLYEKAKESAVEAFLPVNDDLIRTLEAMENSEKESPFYEGIKMIADKFNGVLSSYGVERIDETGVEFDVDLHDAMLRQKTDEDVESGTVLQVLENGYKIGDKTIRHAKVIVSE